jgi:hypothetical protein
MSPLCATLNPYANGIEERIREDKEKSGPQAAFIG